MLARDHDRDAVLEHEGCVVVVEPGAAVEVGVAAHHGAAGRVPTRARRGRADVDTRQHELRGGPGPFLAPHQGAVRREARPVGPLGDRAQELAPGNEGDAARAGIRGRGAGRVDAVDERRAQLGDDAQTREAPQDEEGDRGGEEDDPRVGRPTVHRDDRWTASFSSGSPTLAGRPRERPGTTGVPPAGRSRRCCLMARR